MAVRIKPPKTSNNADFDLIGYIQEKMMKEFSTGLWKGIEDILHLYIDHPIEGELTKEKMKAAGVMGLIHEKYPKPWDIDTSSDKDVKVTINSSILGAKVTALEWSLKESPYWVFDWYTRLGYDEKEIGNGCALMKRPI